MFFLCPSINLSDLLAVSSSWAGVRSGGTAPKRVAQVSTYQADPIPIMSDIVLPAYFFLFSTHKSKTTNHTKTSGKHRCKISTTWFLVIFQGLRRIEGSSAVDPDQYVFGPPGRVRHYLYGSRSGPGSFHRQAKIVRKT
jgi:hypothetical protein